MQFTRSEPPSPPQSAYVKQKDNRCRGSFRQRYECTSKRYLESQQQSFYDWTTRIFIVVLPALALLITSSLIAHRAQRRDKAHRP
ncbi:MAG: hypothetical protein QNJ94_21725 [Alphaproteobacteria bacterium]|nr:hypothetical protein [Alphaproteobacteria bacterium]